MILCLEEDNAFIVQMEEKCNGRYLWRFYQLPFPCQLNA